MDEENVAEQNAPGDDAHDGGAITPSAITPSAVGDHPPTSRTAVITYPDGEDRGWTPGLLLGAGIFLAALAASFLLFNADDTPQSTFVARVSTSEIADSGAVSPAATPTAEAVASETNASEPIDDESATEPATAVPAAEPAPLLLGALLGTDERLNILAELFAATGLQSELDQPGPLTVFAPTDEAFETLIAATQDLGLTEAQVAFILAHHVVPGLEPSSQLTAGTELTTAAGTTITVGADGTIEAANIIDPDLEASNGIAHIVDGVLLPAEALTWFQRLQLEGNTFAALSLFAEAGLRSVLEGPGPITLFVPTDASIEAIDPETFGLVSENLVDVASFHVVEGIFRAGDLTPGTTLTTIQGEQIVIGDDGSLNGNVRLVATDLIAGNGVAHTVDGVLIPPTASTEAALNSLFALEPVQFSVGSAQILAESELVLDEAVAVLLANPTGAVTIAGHTDTDGAEAANQALSQARAESVRAYLIAGGVEAERLTAIGFGEAEPVVEPEVTPDDKAQNRRIEFLVE